jgi:manganese-dependent inorganic pyrophosphatase
VIPVFTHDGRFEGVVGINELTEYASAYNAGHRPEYWFSIRNFDRVLPGRFLQEGEQHEFVASIATGAMSYERSVQRLERLDRKPLFIVGNRTDLLRYAVEQQFPALVVTGVRGPNELEVDFSEYRGTVFLSKTDTAESIRLLRLSSEIDMIVDDSVPRLQHDTPFDEAKAQLLDSEYRGFPVFRGDTFLGMVTRRSFIERPKPRLILMDHNELGQAVAGAEQAEIVEIVDHHRLAAPKTTEAITVQTQPVGSTSTLVWQEFVRQNVSIPQDIAVLLFSGILSDTVNLQSPTTTIIDRQAVEALEQCTGIARDDQAERLFARLKALQNREPREIVEGDFKTYTEAGISFGIGQAEVTTLVDIESFADRLIRALQDVAAENGLTWTMLLITNVIKGNSVLFTNGYPAAESRLVYDKLQEQMFSLPGVLSRKKQLLPEIVRVAQELGE